MSIPLDFADALRERVDGLGPAAHLIAALASHAHDPILPAAQQRPDPLTMADLARMRSNPGFLTEPGVLGAVLAQLPETEVQYLSTLARAHRNATRAERIGLELARLADEFDTLLEGAYTALDDLINLPDRKPGPYPPADNLARQLAEAADRHARGDYTPHVITLEGLPVAIKPAIAPGYLTLTPAIGPNPEAGPARADLVSVTVPARALPPPAPDHMTPARVLVHFRQLADNWHGLRAGHDYERAKLRQIRDDAKQIGEILRGHRKQSVRVQDWHWNKEAFESHCTALAALLATERTEPPSDRPRGALARTVAEAEQAADASYRAHLADPLDTGLHHALVNDALACMTAWRDLNAAGGDRPPAQRVPGFADLSCLPVPTQAAEPPGLAQ